MASYSTITFKDHVNKKTSINVDEVASASALSTLATHLQTRSNASVVATRHEIRVDAPIAAASDMFDLVTDKLTLIFFEAADNDRVVKLSIPAPKADIMTTDGNGNRIALDAIGTTTGTTLGTATGKALTYKGSSFWSKRLQ